MTSQYKKQFLSAYVPFTSDVERMGVHRAPVLASAPGCAASKAYQDLYREMRKKVALK
jgi:chromosome partitioning protein